MPEKIEGRVAELLEAKNFAQVATVRENGSPHVTPVWVDHDGENIVLNTAEGRAWPANARRSGKVAINVVNHENPYEYVYVQGTVAEDTTDGADEHIDKLAKKYMDVDEYPFRQEGEQRLIIKIAPDKVILNSPS
jgi:PPOX class probable F420-dependent enzyme